MGTRSVSSFRLHDVQTVQRDTERVLAEEFHDLGLDFSHQLLRSIEGSGHLEIEGHDSQREVQAASRDNHCGVETRYRRLHVQEGVCELANGVSECFVMSLLGDAVDWRWCSLSRGGQK